MIWRVTVMTIICVYANEMFVILLLFTPHPPPRIFGSRSSETESAAHTAVLARDLSMHRENFSNNSTFMIIYTCNDNSWYLIIALMIMIIIMTWMNVARLLLQFPNHVHRTTVVGIGTSYNLLPICVVLSSAVIIY